MSAVDEIQARPVDEVLAAGARSPLARALKIQALMESAEEVIEAFASDPPDPTTVTLVRLCEELLDLPEVLL